MGSSQLPLPRQHFQLLMLQRYKVSRSPRYSLTCVAHSKLFVTGLDFLSPNLLASSSVEQRLNSYSITSSATPISLSLSLVKSTCLDVADCSAQDAIRIGEEGEKWKVVVAGIGVEVVEASRRTV